MKRLIAMIGAVATAFGLFADDPVTPTAITTSFEVHDGGISTVDEKTIFTPAAASWVLEGEETTIPVAQYADDAFAYGTGALARRDELFKDGEDNNNYLKLSTGTNSLTRNVEGNTFLDQVVKFTGFEEPQTTLADGTKIAVWMSEYVVSEENDVEVTETNLYVTCAKVTADGTEQVALKIAEKNNEKWELGKWYRLTIKSLGSIYGDEPTDSPRAGFVIYINGQQIAAEGDDAKALVKYASEMTLTAKNYMAKGQLFPSIVADTTFTTVGFVGMGAVDDIIIDNVGPEFAQKIPFEVGTLNGKLTWVSVKAGDDEVDPREGVSAGTEVTVTYAAASGWKILGDGVTITRTITDTTTIEPTSEEIDVQAVVATVTPAEGDVKEFAASELYTMINGLVGGDVVLFKDSATIKDGEEATLYEVTANTTITVTDTEGAITWDVYVANYIAEEITTAGSFTDYVGVDAGNTMNVEFEDADNGMLMLYAASVAGTLNVENGQFEIYSPVTVSGTITSAALTPYDIITLSGSGKVVTTDDTLVDTELIVGEGDAKVEVLEDTPEDDWYTYQIQAGVAFTITDETAGTATYKVYVDDVDVTENVPATLSADQTYKVVATAADNYAYEDAGKSSKTLEITGTADTEPITVTVPAATAAKAKKGLLFFLTLQEAIDDAAEGAITLLANVDSFAKYILEKDATINLNGFTLSAATDTSTLFEIHDATLTVNGTVEGSAAVGRFNVGNSTYSGATRTAHWAGNLVLNGGTYSVGNGQTVVHVNGDCTAEENVSVTITGATLTSPTDNGVQFNGYGTYAITGSTITGDTAVYCKAGTLTVTDSDLIATGTAKTPTFNGNGANATGDAIVLDTAAGYQGKIKLTLDAASSVTSADGYAIRETVTSGSASATLEINDAGATKTAALGGLNVTDSFLAAVAAGKATVTGYVATVNGNAYPTLDAALTAAAATDKVTLLTDIELTGTLAINKAITFDLGNKKLSLAPNAAVGIDVTAAATIQNGEITSTLESNVLKSKAINIPNKNVTLKDVDIDAAGYEYAIYANCDEACGGDLEWFYTDTTDKFATLACDGVTIRGNGSLFHVEGMIANLNGCSASRDENELFADPAHCAAVYSAVNATTTITGGGLYEHVNALQSGNLGGKIIVDAESTATFKGDIKSWMTDGAHTELEDYDDYVASFTFNAGTYNGNIVFVDESAEARALDFFKKDLEITSLLPPEGYEWDENGVLVAVQAQPFGGGSGAENDPYIISEYKHLCDLQKWVADGNATAGVYFKQTANIDFADIDGEGTEAPAWTGIGVYKNVAPGGAAHPDYYFGGVYDGNGCSISLILAADRTYAALFNMLDGATIKNLTVNVDKVATPTAAEYGLAAIAGYAINATVISNVTATGTIGSSDTPMNHTTGGFVVDFAGPDSKIIDSVCAVNIYCTKDKMGGFVGFNGTGNSAEFGTSYIRCKYTGTIYVEGNGKSGVGQLIGWSKSAVAIEDCECNGSIVVADGVTTANVGSIAGAVGGSGNGGTGVPAATLTAKGMNKAPANMNPFKICVGGATGLTYATVNNGVATFTDTLVKDTDYVQYLDDASTTIFTLEAKKDYIAFKKGVDTVTLPTIGQIAVADDETLEVKVDTEYTAGVKFVAVEKVTEPIPEIDPKAEDADEKIAAVLDQAEDATELKKVVTKENYLTFRTWARSTGEDPIVAEGAVLASPKAAVSFQLSPIVEGAKLFTADPAVKFTAIAQSGTDWNATLQIKDGADGAEVKLAVEAAVAEYQKFVKVGSVVTAITGTASIKATAADGNKVILTVQPPTGDAGFIKFTTAK